MQFNRIKCYWREFHRVITGNFTDGFFLCYSIIFHYIQSYYTGQSNDFDVFYKEVHLEK